MCYAIGTPNVPGGKYRCDCNTGERKRAGEAHRYNARKHQLVFAAARGRTAVTVETNPYSASPAPYPVSKPKTTGGGWSGLSPKDLLKSKPKKTRDVTENEPDTAPAVDPDQDKSSPADTSDGETAPAPETAPADDATPADDVAPADDLDDLDDLDYQEYLDDLDDDLDDRRFDDDYYASPSLDECEQMWVTGKPMQARDIFAARETMDPEEFALAVRGRTYDEASPLYIDPSRAHAETARDAVVALLADERPSHTLLYDEDLAAQGKTPVYALAEKLDAEQRAAVARAARARSQELAKKWAQIPVGKPTERMNTSIDLGACVMTSSDLEFATACETGQVDAQGVWKTSQAAADSLDKTPAEILDAVGTEDAAKAASLIGDYQMGSLKLPNHLDIYTSGIDGHQLRRDMVAQGAVNDADVEQFRQATKQRMSRLGVGKVLSAKDRDNIATAYGVLASMVMQREMVNTAAGANARAAQAPAARALEETVKAVQPELARAHAHMVRDNMDKVAPRYTGSYRDEIDNRTKSGLSKKAWATLDEAASFLNAREFHEGVTRVRDDYRDVSVNAVSATGRARFECKGIPGSPLRTSATVFFNADKPEVALHETMHMLGFGNDTYREAGTQFLRERTRGLKKQRLSAGNGWGIPDDFSDPYVGRVYDNAAINESESITSHAVRRADSEVLSVGAEHMYSRVWEPKSLAAHRAVSDKAPVTALYDDPEHAALVRGVLTGSRHMEVDCEV